MFIRLYWLRHLYVSYICMYTAYANDQINVTLSFIVTVLILRLFMTTPSILLRKSTQVLLQRHGTAIDKTPLKCNGFTLDNFLSKRATCVWRYILWRNCVGEINQVVWAEYSSPLQRKIALVYPWINSCHVPPTDRQFNTNRQLFRQKNKRVYATR